MIMLESCAIEQTIKHALQSLFSDALIALAKAYEQKENILPQLSKIEQSRLNFNSEMALPSHRMLFFKNWDKIISELDENGCVYLVKGAALAEDLTRWTDGSGTDVSWIWHSVNRRFPDAARAVGIWVRRMTRNPYSPYGCLLEKGFETLDEQEQYRKECAEKQKQKEIMEQAEAKARKQQRQLEHIARKQNVPV